MLRRFAFVMLTVNLICAFGSAPTVATEMDYWFSENNQIYWEAMREIVHDYNASQNDVHVNLYTYIWTEMENKLLTAIAGGAAPDLATLDGCVVAEWVAGLNPFEPLDPYLKRHGIDRSHFIPNEWQEGSLWGKQWSLPWRTASRGLYWNKDLFAVSGLHAEQPPTTLEDLDLFARKITRLSPQGQIEVLGFAPWFNNWNLQGWFWTFGGQLYDWQENVYTIDRPEHLNAMRWVKSYVERYGAPILDFRKGVTGNTRFSNEELGMLLQSTSYISTLHGTNPDINYGVGLPPYPKGGANGNWGGGFSHVMPVTAKNKDAAGHFLAYLAKPEVQLKWYERTGLLPTHWEAVRRLLRVTGDERVRVMIEGLPTANARTPYWLALHRNLNTANNELINGTKSPEQILAEQQKAIEILAAPLRKPR